MSSSASVWAGILAWLGRAVIGIGLIVLLVLVVLVVFWFIGIYNRLVSLRNGVDAAWKQVDVQLQKRYDLIPNLVETVKGYAAHEKDTLERVIAARNQAVSAKGAAEQ